MPVGCFEARRRNPLVLRGTPLNTAKPPGLAEGRAAAAQGPALNPSPPLAVRNLVVGMC